MNAKDAVLAKKLKGKKKRNEGASSNRDKKKRRHEVLGKPQEKKKGACRLSLIMPIEQVLMQIRDDPSLQWLKLISTPLERRNKSKSCRFHQDHGHHTDECRHLKDQVETLIRQGKL